jgi:arginase
MQLSLIGAPTDVGASAPAADSGPGGLRIAGLGTALTALGHDVEDAGDLVGPPNPRQPP